MSTALPPRDRTRRTKAMREDKRVEKSEFPQFCVIGGGIAGVCCAQELSRLNPSEQIVLISATDVLREATAIMKLTSNLEELSVFERRTDQFCMDNKNIRVLQSSLTRIDSDTRRLHLSDGSSMLYSHVCVATGSQPKTLFPKQQQQQQLEHPRVLTIRDVESVSDLAALLQHATSVTVVGNGGIAMELVTALTFCDVTWLIKDGYIGSAFFDATASSFVAPGLLERCAKDAGMNMSAGEGGGEDAAVKLGNVSVSYAGSGSGGSVGGDKRTVGEAEEKEREHGQEQRQQQGLKRRHGSALGPEWVNKSNFLSSLPPTLQRRSGSLRIVYEDEIASVVEEAEEGTATACRGGKMRVVTKKGDIIRSDFVVAAIGVAPNTDCLGPTSGAIKDNDGALVVNARLETSIPDVYAAGDCCVVKRFEKGEKDTTHWFQMRLWTQARIMGHYAAQCMHEARMRSAGEEMLANDIGFELFAHITRFFGHKVVLLGRYNAQGLYTHSHSNDTGNGTGTGTGTGSGGLPYEARVKEMVVTPNGLVDRSVARTVAQQGDGYAVGGQQVRHVPETELPPETAASFLEQEMQQQQQQQQAMDTQSVTNELEVWIRVTPGEEYVKCVVYRGKVVGALLLGDTDLEECFENLILNRIDVSGIGSAMLDPEIDLEDYFD